MEVVQQQEQYRLKQVAIADLKRLLAVTHGDNSWLESASYEQLCQVRENRKAAERQAEERARQRRSEITYQEYARLRNAQVAEREAVCCTPSREALQHNPVERCHTLAAKAILGQQLDRNLKKYTTPRERVAYEWGYIKALQDLGQTEEAQRLLKKLRRGSIFSKEKSKAAAEVQELETLYKR